MRFTFDGYEIEIKAKNEYSQKFNKADTVSILNSLSIYAGEAATRYEQIGMAALGQRAREFADTTYNLLDAAGAYKDL